jgi:hypothetical protein
MYSGVDSQAEYDVCERCEGDDRGGELGRMVAVVGHGESLL